MIDRNLRIFAQRDPVQTVRQLEHAPPYVLQLKIGLRQLFAQFVALVLELLGVVPEVPRHQLGVEALSAGVAGHGFHIAARSLDRPVEQLRQKGVDRRGALGHTLFQHVVGICLVSKQTGKLQTLVGNFLDNGGVVELAAHAAGVISLPELLFQGAIRRISHKRDHTGNLQRDDPSVEPALLGLGRHALADEVGQLPDDGRIGHMKRKGIRGRQRVLVELKAQLREAGGQFAVYLLVSVGKGRAAAGEPLVGLFEQSPLFGVQPQRLPPIVNRLDPGEQLRIEAYVVAELGQHGRKLQRESLHRIVRMRLVQVEENIGDAVQTTAAELERLDRIGECRGLGVADDRGDVGASLAHGLLESRLVMLVRDLRELRSSVGSRRLDEQRIDVRAGRAERQGCCHTTDY